MYKKAISVIAALVLVTALFSLPASASHTAEVTLEPDSTKDNHREHFTLTVHNLGPDLVENVEIELAEIAGVGAYVALRDAAESYEEIVELFESIGGALEVAENELKAYGDVLVDNVCPLVDSAVISLLTSELENARAAAGPLSSFSSRLEDAGEGMSTTPVDFTYIGGKVSGASDKLDDAGSILAGDPNENLQAAGENLRLAAAILENVADNLAVGSLLTPSLDLADVAEAMIAAGEVLQNYGEVIGDTIEDAGEDLIDAANLLAPPYEAEVEATIIIQGKDTAYNQNTPVDSPPEPWVLYDNYPPILAAGRAGDGAIIAGGISSSCRNGRWNSGANTLPYLDKFLDAAFQWGKPGAEKVLWYEGYYNYNDTDRCSDLVEALEDLDYSVDATDAEPITSSMLAPYDVLIIAQLELGAAGTEGDPSLLPDADVAAIVDFVKAGGVLFIAEGNDSFGYNYNAVQNKILTAFGFGLHFQNDSVYDDTNKWGGNWEIIADVITENEIGEAYENETGENEIGLYSLCSMAVPLPRARELYNAGVAIKRAGTSLGKVTDLLSEVGSDFSEVGSEIGSLDLMDAGALISDAAGNLDIVDDILSDGTTVVDVPLADAAGDLDNAADILREKLGGSGIGSAADNLDAAAGLLTDNAAELAEAGGYFLGASSGFSDASEEVAATAVALDLPLGWDWDGSQFVSENYHLGKVIVSGKVTAHTIDQTDYTPRKYYGVGDRPPIIAAAEVGDGRVVAAGTAPTCRNDRWKEDEWEIFLDNVFQWMVENAENVLWYEGYGVYNNTTQCESLIDNLEVLGYTVTGDDTEPITSTLLAPYDVLVIPQLQSDIPPSDIDVIVDFVEGGGGLLIMDGSDSGGYNYAEIQNKILEGLEVGIRFQDDQVNDSTNNWKADHYPIADVDTTTWIGSAYENATENTEICLYSVCSLIVIEEDPRLAECENIELPFLMMIEEMGADISVDIPVYTYDVPYGDVSTTWVTLTIDGVPPTIQRPRVEQEGTPLGLVGSVNDGGRVTVEVRVSESLSKLGDVYPVDTDGDNLLPPLDMTPDEDNRVWAGEFYVDNEWDDQRIYVRVEPGSEDLLGNEVTEAVDSSPIQLVNSAPEITDNGFTAARATYIDLVLEMEDGGVRYATENSIWEISGVIEHVPEYFDSLRFNENWWVVVSLNGVEVDNVERVPGENRFTFSENEVDLGADGPKTITLRVVDAAGNMAENIQENIFLDNTDPTIDFVEIDSRSFWDEIPVNITRPILSLELADSGFPGTGLGILENEGIEWTLLDEDNVEIELENLDPLENVRKGEIELRLGLPENADNLEEGTYTLTISATDGINQAEENFRFVVDTTPGAPPSLEVSYPTTTSRDSPRILTVETLELIGPVGSTERAIHGRCATITVYVDDEDIHENYMTTARSDGSWEKEVELTPGVVLKIQVSATDVAGNESGKTLYGYVLVDASAPGVTIEAAVTSTSSASVEVTGTVSKDSWEEYTDLTLTLQVGMTGPIEVPINLDGSFSYSVALSEGSNIITARVEDPVGNWGSSSVSVERTVTPWATYAAIVAIIAVILAAIAVLRRRS